MLPRRAGAEHGGAEEDGLGRFGADDGDACGVGKDLAHGVAAGSAAGEEE